MGGFLTEEYASRKWLMRILSFMGFGGYCIGKNNGNIFVQDRRTGRLLEEKMPSYVRLGIRLLYQNMASTRAVDSTMAKQLFQRVTLKQGRKFDDPTSVRNIPEFIRFHDIHMDEVLEPLENFHTFNQFFYRKLNPDARVLASASPHVAVSPADCRLGCFPTVLEATRLWIKGTSFGVESLLRDTELASYFMGGSLVLCRLAPQDYHRFHSPVDGLLVSVTRIAGTYYTVNPMAVRQRIDVLTDNTRTVCIIDSTCFGRVAFVAIGAMMVGSIVMTAEPGACVARMDELGYFAFGGSTIVVLFPRNSIELDADLVRNSQEQLETLVQVGNSIGRSLRDVL